MRCAFKRHARKIHRVSRVRLRSRLVTATTTTTARPRAIPTKNCSYTLDAPHAAHQKLCNKKKIFRIRRRRRPPRRRAEPPFGIVFCVCVIGVFASCRTRAVAWNIRGISVLCDPDKVLFCAEIEQASVAAAASVVAVPRNACGPLLRRRELSIWCATQVLLCSVESAPPSRIAQPNNVTPKHGNFPIPNVLFCGVRGHCFVLSTLRINKRWRMLHISPKCARLVFVCHTCIVCCGRLWLLRASSLSLSLCPYLAARTQKRHHYPNIDCRNRMQANWAVW